MTSRTRAGIVAAIAIVVIMFITFAGSPIGHSFEIRGVFRTSNQLAKGDPVRIAGRDVGTVEKVEAGARGTSVVVMHIDDRTVPLRTDAKLTIDPRLVLEGSYVIDVQPGTPTAAPLKSGATVPLTQTRGLVQIDQVLNTFTHPIRQSLNGAVADLSTAVGPLHGTRSGARGIRQTASQLDRSLASLRRTADAMQGTKPGDLSGALAATGRLTSQASERPADLAGIVTNFDRTVAAISANDAALGQTVVAAAGALRVAPDRLRRINAALPNTTVFAKALEPVLRQAPGPLNNLDRMVEQLNSLLAAGALPKLLTTEIRPTTATLPALNVRLGKLFPLLTSAADCVTQNVLPALNTVIKDPLNSTGDPAWQDLLHFAANLASAAANSDGNGVTLRLGVTEGEQALRATIPGIGPVLGVGNIQGLAPSGLGPGVQPPYRAGHLCTDQQLPNINSRYEAGVPLGYRETRYKPTAESRGLQRILESLRDRDRTGILRAVLDLPTIRALHDLLLKRQRGGATKPSRKTQLVRHPPAATPPASRPVGPLVVPPVAKVNETLKHLLDFLKPKR